MPKRLRQSGRAALLLACAAILTATDAAGQAADDAYTEDRLVLVRDIEQHVYLTSKYLGRSELSARTVGALERVPRHEFVPESLRRYAYDDRPLPIGHGQTISQPYIVAIMTDLLDLEPECTVLDIGTGSGYQAAMLAELCDSVYSIEIVEPLGRAARQRLARLGYDNVTVRIGDGFHGWAEHAPFDGIVVAAVADELPAPLLAQLKPGGRIIMPVERPGGDQELVLGERRPDGTLARTRMLPVRFVPLTRDPD
ncbi:MAG: protein-L-isoaspartate(D-aspartate) O-methyltransferase [Gammaproteobacteria bacterium]